MDMDDVIRVIEQVLAKAKDHKSVTQRLEQQAAALQAVISSLKEIARRGLLPPKYGYLDYYRHRELGRILRRAIESLEGVAAIEGGVGENKAPALTLVKREA